MDACSELGCRSVSGGAVEEGGAGEGGTYLLSLTQVQVNPGEEAAPPETERMTKVRNRNNKKQKPAMLTGGFGAGGARAHLRSPVLF